MNPSAATFGVRKTWAKRLRALRNIPPVLRIVWDSGPAVVVSGTVLRILSAVIPLAMLAVTRLIIDAVVAHVANHLPLAPHFWRLVVLEFVLAGLGAVLTKGIDYC